MKKKWVQLLSLMFILFILSGCLYPDDNGSSQSIDPKESILIVQSAVDTYQEITGLLPIKNSEMETPIYEKYVIDFKKLTDPGYLSRIPSNAFEGGGTHYFVLIDVDKDVKVKLLDLISIQQVREIQLKVLSYVHNHSGRIPNDKEMNSNWYSIDFDKINMDRVQIKSVYSEQFLSLLIHSTGKVVIDYAPEIMKIISNNNITITDLELDLRTYLVDHSYYVPAQSEAYYWKDGQPVIADIQE